MLFIKLIERLCNIRILKLLITKKGPAKYRKLIAYFSQNLQSFS